MHSSKLLKGTQLKLYQAAETSKNGLSSPDGLYLPGPLERQHAGQENIGSECQVTIFQAILDISNFR